MTAKPTYSELERKIVELEKKILDSTRKEIKCGEERKLREYSHTKRTISLMQINKELNRELSTRKRAYEEELGQVSHKLKDRIKELNCLYDISSFNEDFEFSLDNILQTIVNLVPQGCIYPESTGARILFDDYEFSTKNFKETEWKLSREIRVYNERIGILEVCHQEEELEFDMGSVPEEEKNLINAIAESVARIIEREWAEVEIIKLRGRIEELLQASKRTSTSNSAGPD